MTERAGKPSLVRRQKTLGAVLDDRQVVLPRQLHNGIEIGGQAEDMHGDDGPGEGAELAPYVGRIDVEGPRIAIGKHGHCPALEHDEGRGGHRAGGHDHLVAGPHARGQQTRQQRSRAAVVRNRIRDPELLGKRGLETLQHVGGFPIAEARVENFVHITPVGLAATAGRKMAENLGRIERLGVFGDQFTYHRRCSLMVIVPLDDEN